MKIQFKNPAHHTGLNLTVRNGEKWYNMATINTPLEIVRTGDEDHVLLNAHVVGVYKLDWSAIGQFSNLLVHEHDPSCVTVEGLADAMDRAYGVGEWGPTITFVLYSLLR